MSVFLPAGRKPNMTNAQEEHINKHFCKNMYIFTPNELTIQLWIYSKIIQCGCQIGEFICAVDEMKLMCSEYK